MGDNFIKPEDCKDIAEIFKKLSDRDQLELFKYFHYNYTHYEREEWDLDGIMHVLGKLCWFDQMDIIGFFQDIYDPDKEVL